MKHLFFLVFFATFQPSHFWIFNPQLVGCFVKIIRNDQRQNIVSIISTVVTPLTVVIQMKGFEKHSQRSRLGKQKYEDLKNLKCCLDLQMREFYVFIKVILYLYLVSEDNSPGRIQAAPLSWLIFVTSHSSRSFNNKII